MELTNILGRLKPESNSPKPFLALELTDEVVAAAVWHVDDGITQVIALGPAVEWKEGQDKNSEDNLVHAVDTTISAAIEGLPIEPTEAVFGLPSSWTTPDGIEDAKLKLIKLVSRELEIKPLGFVVVIDSLLRYLKMQEGTPSTSILIHVTHDEITVRHVLHGKIEGSHSVGRSDDIALDVEEGISRLKIAGNLPSRIIVFDGIHDLDDIVQNLVSYDWQSKFQFLHLPKVESLVPDIVIRSIAIAGGAEVAKSIGFEIAEPEPSQPVPADPPTSPTESTDKTETPTSRHADTPMTPDFGFSDTPPPTAHTIPDRKGNPDPGSSITKFKLPSLPKFPHLNLHLPQIKSGNKLVITIALILLTLSSIATAIWFVPHATVTIYVTPKMLEENIPITLSTSATSINLEGSIIPATIIPTSVSGTDTVTTTGTKTIGDKATGEVTIYNRTDLVKSFDKGTTLESNGISFSLDDNVTIASASSGTDYELVPGKATVKIIADSIGEEANLTENTEFSLENYSLATYIARNESSLSGGTSNEIRVVSADDLATLLDNLSSKLQEEARVELLSSSEEGSGIYLLEDSFELTSESYSAEIGEEANSLQGTIEVQVSALHYLTTDIEELVATRIKESIPPGYIRTIDLPTVELSSAKSEKDSEVIAEAKVSIRLLPQLNESSFQSALRGLSSTKIQSTLSSVVGMDSAYVAITPSFLPPKWKMMPRNPANISIIIKSTN